MVIPGGILFFAVGLRAWKLGELSFWYDEVVTMRLATAPTLAALFDRLFQIDATRRRCIRSCCSSGSGCSARPKPQGGL